MDILFVPGQRWVSNTESELGLGIILETVNRRVTVSFPAVGERRTYAADNAPLNRVLYAVGEKICNADGVCITITKIEEQGGYLTYQGFDKDGKELKFEEIDLDSFVQFSRPQDRLFAGQIDKNSRFELRIDTLLYKHRLEQNSAYGLLGPRVQLLPHQLYIADKVAKRHAPRVLLADEVGLGKTIEAGLIVHQQLITGQANRVLIIVPDSLVHQWLVEMSRRFNLQFTILDEERCLALDSAEQGNPFESAQLILCALSWITENKERHAQALQATWDILVVDEAHHLEWSETEVSSKYACVETLAEKIPGLLLLTATPEQLGVEGHFARLRLLDPDRYFNIQNFLKEEESYKPINDLVQKLLMDDSLEKLKTDTTLQKELLQYFKDDKNFDIDIIINSKEALDGVIQSLLDRHGTGRVLFRNTRETVEGFPERYLHSHPLEVPEEFSKWQELQKDAHNQHEDLINKLLHPELFFGERWLSTDPRVQWLVDWLKDNRETKVLLICAYAQTAIELENYLRVTHAIRSAVFHEQLDLISRDRAAAYFYDEEEGAQVLLCSEIGSEGRNFQFSHNLILFDLPLNPDLLEQRIGRLDRIGQLHAVQIHIPFYKNAAQENLFIWYHQGLNAFQQVCSVGYEIYKIFESSLTKNLICNDKEQFLQFVEKTQKKSNELQSKLQLGRDRLLELNSCNPQIASEILNNIIDITNQLELANYMERVFDQFGVDQQYHSAHSVVVQPGDHMHGHSFPGLGEDGLTATYDRAKGLVREDMQFHTWEHPMVLGAMDMIISSDFGNSTLCTVKLQSLKSGSLLLESIYTIHCVAPKDLKLYRYLPQTMIRVVIDEKNNDLSRVLTIEHMNRLTEKLKETTAKDIIKHVRVQITNLIKNSEIIAEAEKKLIMKESIQKMITHKKAELNRITALSKINASIRKDEIDYLKFSIVKTEEFMQQAKLKLDAIRVSVVT